MRISEDPYLSTNQFFLETATTKGIKVSVVSRFEDEHSNPQEGKYIHSYTITISNESEETVQLLSRHWIIKDSLLNEREVKGEGVVGKQPTLAPGESHQYSSWCPLGSELGKMYGTFLMMRLRDQSTFKVVVPVFKLFANPRLN